MNRKILFRGKLTSGRGWSYGNLNIRPNNITVITPFNGHIGVYGQVIPDTVGQYTGLNDTNGKEIFEGDIVRNKDVWDKYTGVIVFKNGRFMVDWHLPCGWEGESITLHTIDISPCDEVIGNSYDNPELLKKP